jgi:hypothetical protein
MQLMDKQKTVMENLASEQIIFHIPFWILDGLCGEDVSYSDMIETWKP